MLVWVAADESMDSDGGPTPLPVEAEAEGVEETCCLLAAVPEGTREMVTGAF